MAQILKPFAFALASVYFLVDAAFVTVAKPISRWIGNHFVMTKLRIWIRSLRPYPSLALFSIPVILLEPVKPLAAYFAATGQMLGSISTLIVGELLKLVIIERLFSLTRDKLLKIPAFAWAYGKFRQGKAWIKATAAWRALQSVSNAVRAHFVNLKTKARASILAKKLGSSKQ